VFDEKTLMFLMSEKSVDKDQLIKNSQAATKFYLVLDAKPTRGKGETLSDDVMALGKYVQLGNRIRQNAGAAKFIDAIWEGFKDGWKRKVFNALCVPSETGKTQLAFAMPKSKCDVIYMNMGARTGEFTERQNVYKNFDNYMSFILQRLPEDYKNMGDVLEDKFWIYGFIKSLMQLLLTFKGDLTNLPADLSRVRVATKPGVSHTQAFLISPADLNDAQEAIVFFESRLSASSKVLFFVDEFMARAELPEETLAFFRQRLMNLGRCVVVASTDSGAANMMKSAAATGDTRKEPGNLWLLAAS
jgi:hypothetical protein